MGIQLDKWIEKVRRCEYLAEDELKALCEYVRLLHEPSMCLMVGTNACQPAYDLLCNARSRRYLWKSPMCSQ